jgi:hypothetical protein
MHRHIFLIRRHQNVRECSFVTHQSRESVLRNLIAPAFLHLPPVMKLLCMSFLLPQRLARDIVGVRNTPTATPLRLSSDLIVLFSM